MNSIDGERNRLLFLGIGVIMIVAAVAIGFLVFGGDNSPAPEQAVAPETAMATTAAATTSQTAPPPSTTEQQSARPEFPQLPSGAVAVNDAALDGQPGGDFNNVYRGSSVTSSPFSLAVRDAYVRNYVETGQLNATVDVFSTVTNTSYSMSCSDNGQYVTCTGGNNAIVFIV